MWMPAVNGWQFAAALVERGVSIPLLVMTASKDASAYATTVGAVGFIGKPFNLDQLILAVRDGVPPPVDGDGLPPPVRPPLVPV
jgi:FixJ family two-component response regulator